MVSNIDMHMNSKRPTYLAVRLKRELKKLRVVYSNALKSQEGGTFEWLRDNYYLLEREGRSAYRELKHAAPLPSQDSLPDIYLLCEDICRHTAKSLETVIRTKIEQYKRPLNTKELESFILMLRIAFIHLAFTAVRQNDTESSKIIGQSVTGLRALSSVDLDGLIEDYSQIERVFSKDPAGIYSKMNEETRALYRKTCAEMAERAHIPEEKEAETILSHAKNAKTMDEQHVGFYLFECGDAHRKKRIRGIVFLALRLLLPLIVSLPVSLLLNHWWLVFIIYFPIFEILRPVIEFFANKGVKPNFLPRMELKETIPESAKTVVIVSTLVPPADRAGQLGKKLKQLLLKNHRGEIKFCLLCDLKQSSIPSKPEDDASIKAITRVVEGLNQEYDNKFLLVVRPRVKIETQNAYAGYERKRGAIQQLVQFIKGENIRFLKMCGDIDFLRETRYLIALDSDTDLLMNAATGLVSAALHPLNTPKFNEKTGTIERGYGIIAPRISTDLKSAGRTPFSRVMSGAGGITAYDTLSNDLYQDLFGQSIFAGKGLIDVDAFYQCMVDAFPEERVLSHDILEGAYLRTAFMSDIELTDGCPPSATSFMGRLHRWVRGDWQNLLWLFRKVPSTKGQVRMNPLSGLSKYMLADNLRRSLTEPAALLCVLLSFFLPKEAPYLALIALWSSISAPLFSALYSLFSGGIQMLSNQYYSRVMPAALTYILQAVMQASLLFYTAIKEADAIIRSIYRQFVSKKNLLEWTTAADLEKRKDSFWFVLRQCGLPIFLGILLMLVSSSTVRLVAVLAIVSPLVIYFTKKANEDGQSQLGPDEREQLRSYAAAMWRFYDELGGARDNYLPPDNVQESPVHAVAHRTSPTNIGLMMLCTLAARDFGFIDTPTLVRKISQTLGTVEKLEKWNGNLLNWYNTKTLEPLYPRFVSTVDSGNFACCLITLCEGMLEYKNEDEEIDRLCERISLLTENIDLQPFYNERRKLFHIGYDLDEEKLSTSFYDLLMSEARMTSYYAIATRKVPKKHWGALGRTLAKEGTYSGPVSWTGTMFEYFMPHLLLPVYEDSLGFEALRFCVYCQRKRAKSKNAPFGCSESGFYAFDSDFNYQYKAHGVQRIGLKRRLNEEFVVSPYSSFLVLPFLPKTTFKNLRRLEKLGMTGRMGFYEAVDFTKSRAGSNRYAIIKSYMAHHVGMSLIATTNALYKNTMQQRFMRAGSMRAAEELLQEKIPFGSSVFEDVIERDVPEKPGRLISSVEEYTEQNPLQPHMQLLSNGEWSLLISDCGDGVSTCQKVDITRRSEDNLRQPQGIFAAVEAESERFFITRAPDYYDTAERRAENTSNSIAFYAHKEILEAGMMATVHPSLAMEQRRFMIKNRSGRRITARLLCYFEPCLAHTTDYAAHPAFSKLFLQPEYDENVRALVFTRRCREGETPKYLAVGFMDARSFEYECSREYLLKRPEGTSSLLDSFDRAFHQSKGVPDPCAALRISFDLAPRANKQATLLMAMGSDRDSALASIIACRREGLLSAAKSAPSPLFEGGLESRIAAMVLPALCYPVYHSEQKLLAVKENTRGCEALWGMSISCDYPIVLVEIGEQDDFTKVEPFIQMYKKLRRCGVLFDLVISYEEGGDYTQPASGYIRQAAIRADCEHLLFKDGGIHPVDIRKVGEDAKTILRAAARYIAPQNIVKKPDGSKLYQPAYILPAKKQDRVFPDGFKTGGGVFSGDSFYITNTPDLPWCQVLANEQFGTLVSDCALGYTWAYNARENKLTPWYNDTRTDNRGEMLLLKTGQGYVDLIMGAAVQYQPGAAIYTSEYEDFGIETRVHIPPKGMVKFVDVSIFNRSSNVQDSKICYYTEPVLGVNRASERHIHFKWEDGKLFLHNPYNTAFSGYMMLTADGGADDFSCNRPAFLMGKEENRESAPVSCAAIYKTVQTAPGEKRNIRFMLTFGGTEQQAYEQIHVNSEPVHAYNRIELETPDQSLNYMVNTWLPQQIEKSRIFGRTGFYQCGGAYGFRDQLQDICAGLQFNPAVAREHILRSAAHQFLEGDVLHWWHNLPAGDAGVRTRCSDDMLWLPYAVCEYVNVTGDTGILDEEIPFLEAPELLPHEDERYFTPEQSKETASLYEHCLRAARRVSLGEHDLALIGNGDWNDGFSSVGTLGKGESVWLSQFAALVYERLAGLSMLRQDHDAARVFLSDADALKKAVDAHAWDGEWYLRAFFDDGRPMGHKGNTECEIDLLPQAFSVISGMPDEERIKSSIDSAIKYLVDEEARIIKLFTPPFEKDYDPGYIRSYPKGVRENGGQYTHAAVWLVYALFRAGRSDEAYRLLRMLNPAQRCSDEKYAHIYKTEPYYLTADIYDAPGARGRGGWSIYTGASGWFYRAVVCEMCGIQRKGAVLELHPTLPSDWEGFRAKLLISGTPVDIQVMRGEEKGLQLDGSPAPSIPLDERAHNVVFVV